MFECWYSLKPKVKKNAAENVQRALDIISHEEYEFIETVNDIDIKMTKEEKQQVFEEIQKRIHLAGKIYTKRKTRR